jgi:lysophospholipase L1-like esterase
VRRALLVASGLLLVLGGCTTDASLPGAKARPTPPPYPHYVALGDSYSAGPLIPTTDLASGCARSDHNYPSLLAKRLKVSRFVDVTCSGATTHDVTHVQNTFGDARIPPQVKALTPTTNLVTISIGGNDLDLFATLVRTCTQLRSTDPAGSPCARQLAAQGPDLTAATRTISANVTGLMREIRRRAPGATVVLVGYLRLVPDHGRCAALPLADGDYAEGRRISRVLDTALGAAARRSGVLFADMYHASKGHDVCSKHPWVNGSVTNRHKALSYHPFASGMRADEREVLRLLEQR